MQKNFPTSRTSVFLYGVGQRNRRKSLKRDSKGFEDFREYFNDTVDTESELEEDELVESGRTSDSPNVTIADNKENEVDNRGVEIELEKEGIDGTIKQVQVEKVEKGRKRGQKEEREIKSNISNETDINVESNEKVEERESTETITNDVKSDEEVEIIQVEEVEEGTTTATTTDINETETNNNESDEEVEITGVEEVEESTDNDKTETSIESDEEEDLEESEERMDNNDTETDNHSDREETIQVESEQGEDLDMETDHGNDEVDSEHEEEMKSDGKRTRTRTRKVVMAQSPAANPDIELVTIGKKTYQRVRVDEPDQVTPNVRRSKRRKLEPIKPGEIIEYQHHWGVTPSHEFGAELKCLLRPLPNQKTVRPQATRRTKKRDDKHSLVVDDPSTGETIREKIVTPLDSIASTNIKGERLTPEDDVFYQKYINNDSMVCGHMTLKKHSKKPPVLTGNNSFVFYVIKGHVTLTVHNETFPVSSMNWFTIPQNTAYSISNDKGTTAVIMYFINKS